MTNCPSEATLRLIGTEAVGEETFAGLEGHVENCPECQKILEAATKAVPRATRGAAGSGDRADAPRPRHRTEARPGRDGRGLPRLGTPTQATCRGEVVSIQCAG